jgi:sugar phosphate isomerase/epimerase
MLTRRRFGSLLVTAAGAVLTGRVKLGADTTRSGLAFGVQTYTIRDRLKDLPATLRLIREIGYASVEGYPFIYDRPAKELKAVIANSGLTVPSGHFDYLDLEERVDYAAELGLEYMICTAIPRPQWTSIEGYQEAAKHLNKVAPKVLAAGLKFGYHPHNCDFKPLKGGRGFDVLMQNLDPSVRLELDIYWAVEAGQDPLVLMREHHDRLALIHIKDRKQATGFTYDPADARAAHFTEAGSGTIDWKMLLGEAKRLGVKQYFVDQDGSDLPIEESLRINWNYLSQLSL